MRSDYKSLLALAVSTVLVIVPFLLFGDFFDVWAVNTISATDRVSLLLLVSTVLLAVDAVLPIPSSVVSALVIASAGPFLGGASIWIGTLLASLIGYGIGATAGRALPSSVTPKASDMMQRYGVWAVFVTKAVPVLGEAVALAAGAIGLPFYSFAAVSTLASLVLAGAYAGTALLVPASMGQVPAMFFVALLVPLVAMLVFNLFVRLRGRAAK